MIAWVYLLVLAVDILKSPQVLLSLCIIGMVLFNGSVFFFTAFSLAAIYNLYKLLR